MRVLHITNWYKLPEEPFRTPFIKEHIDSLQKFCDNDLVHIEVFAGNKSIYKPKYYRYSEHEESHLLYTFKIPWRLREVLTHRMLVKILKSKKVNENYDLINFHVAYPLLTYTEEIKKILKIPFVITEHWTAYHFNFNLPLNTTKLDRIKQIFKHQIPVITVSKALGDDIRSFSGNSDFKNFIVPNVINPAFSFQQEDFEKIDHTKRPSFFMLNLWRGIKSPFICFEAFRAFLKDYPNAVLRVGGYGPLWEDMEEYVRTNNLSNNIILLGKLTKEEAAAEMQNITAFIHAAEYETFSVVNAEALSCGTPVIMTYIPAVAEFVNASNGLLIENKDRDAWLKALHTITLNNHNYNRKEISKTALGKFSQESVGKSYYNVFTELLKS